VSKKILIAAFGFYPEQHGVAQAAYQQALGLHQLGYQVTVITRTKTPDNLPFEVIPVFQKAEYQLLLKSSDAEVVFFHGWHNWVSDWAIPVFPLKGKTVLVSHGTNFNVRLSGLKGGMWWLKNRFTAATFPLKMSRFDHLIFLSNKLEKQRMSDVILAKNQEKSNYSIIPNGARPAFLNEISVDFCIKDQIKTSTILLCVSNFQPSKGQGELLAWFTELGLPDTALVLIGSEFNAFSEQLKKQADKQLDKTVFFFEKLNEEQLYAAYRAANVFVSATCTEVQPLMLLDAMAVGLPFLCRDVGVVSELEGGICFETPEGFKEKLGWLLKGALLRELLGKAGKKAVLERYNWERSAKKYHFLVQNVLTSRS
jgi:glycosyltransferase involved in cell wall biosynthesis